MGVGRGAVVRDLPWIFMHGTDIIDKGLIVLFFGHFLLPPPLAAFRMVLDFTTCRHLS